MRFHRQILILAIYGLLVLNPTSFTAGEIIDFWPEIQLARSFAYVPATGYMSLGFDPLFNPPEECPRDLSVSALPKHLLVDENGTLRTEEENLEIAFESMCFLAITEWSLVREIEDFRTRPYGQIAFQLIQGDDVTLSDGSLVPSTQLMRSTSAFYVQHLINPGSPWGLIFSRIGGALGADYCSELFELIESGRTLESGFAPMWVLAFNYGAATFRGPDDSFSFEPRCSPIFHETDSELIALAMEGDTNAAIALAGRKFAEILKATELTIELREFIESDRERLQFEILRYSERFPLVSLSYSTVLSVYELVLIVIE